VDLRGQLGLAERDVRAELTSRFGAVPQAGKLNEITDALRVFYRQRGYADAKVTARVEETHAPDRASMVLTIDSGRRASISRLDVNQVDGAAAAGSRPDIGVGVGDPYDNQSITEALERYAASLRADGFYEARAIHTAAFEPDGTATVDVTIDRGPQVVVAFAGDPLPEAEQERLVPVRAEGSADEDLLEDADIAIRQYLQARGYRDARVSHASVERDGIMTITFTVQQGARYLVDQVSIEGNMAIPTLELQRLTRIEPGQPLVQSAVVAAIAAIQGAYRARGFTQAAVEPALVTRAGNGGNADRRVVVGLDVREGPRTMVASVGFDGNTVLSAPALTAMIPVAPGRLYSESDIITARDAIDLEYRNRGYENIVVTPQVALGEDGTSADVRFAVVEGPQIIVDDIIIVGNERTSTETIERELLLRAGEPLGYSARIESQQRLAALGLFRRVVIQDLPRTDDALRDLLVQVEEAPPTTIGYGGGVEGGVRLRPTGSSGQAEERFELSPRGFFEIGRRNLWGKNRAINLFSRVSLRSRDIILSEGGVRFEEPAEGGGYGFNEYRIYATFREPRLFNTPADMLVTGILDQAIRSSFNFITREARAEAGLRAGRFYSFAGRYSYEHTRLFDERFTESEKPLIDRVFPQVRISKFSVSAIRDSRNDVLDPDRGVLTIVDSELAARALGSEVGFVTTFLQGFGFFRMPSVRRAVVAVGGRLGLAHGFRRSVPRVDDTGRPITGPDGSPVVDVVQDLPASERFFAGGDTTVRGFSLDRLGTSETISATGFPTGGNGVVVLNTELRFALLRGLGAVTFFDAGNVFLRATDIDLGALRGAAGFGLRYQSPVGPIRIDLGFKLDRRELTPGSLEGRSALHISLGQAF
jgi:outer membrane protein insertion porin family